MPAPARADGAPRCRGDRADAGHGDTGDRHAHRGAVRAAPAARSPGAARSAALLRRSSPRARVAAFRGASARTARRRRLRKSLPVPPLTAFVAARRDTIALLLRRGSAASITSPMQRRRQPAHACRVRRALALRAQVRRGIDSSCNAPRDEFPLQRRHAPERVRPRCDRRASRGHRGIPARAARPAARGRRPVRRDAHGLQGPRPRDPRRCTQPSAASRRGRVAAARSRRGTASPPDRPE